MSDAEFPVVVTAPALARLRLILDRKAQPGQFIRLGVKGGGCSGLEYLVKIEERQLPNDLVTEIEGVRIVCDPKSAEFLRGSSLVASGNLVGGGLVFENPNAARSCGCGASFIPKP